MWFFDVDTSTNEIGRLFFWHKGGIPENGYRTAGRAMAIGELKNYLQKNLTREEWFYTDRKSVV